MEERLHRLLQEAFPEPFGNLPAPRSSSLPPTKAGVDPLPPGEVYIIMPATFEGKKTGPFMVSVETDVDFLLAKDEPKRR